MACLRQTCNRRAVLVLFYMPMETPQYPLAIQLPLLHAQEKAGYLSLNPGCCPQEPDTWCPGNYPLSLKEARFYLQSLARLAPRELEHMRHGLSHALQADSWRFALELMDLRSFRDQAVSDNELLAFREQAQKNLIWQWHAEELLFEIHKLEYQCILAEEQLTLNFVEADFPDPQDPVQTRMAEVNPAVAWDITLANASFFIPPDIPVLATGEMAETLADRLESREMENGLSCAKAPLYMALGHGRGWLNDFCCAGLAEIFSANRLWLWESPG